MRTTTRTRRRTALAALPLGVGLALSLAACGGEEVEAPESADVAEEVDGDVDLLDGEAAEDLVGLEVTFVGDVTEVLDDDYGFRVDKDGLDVEAESYEEHLEDAETWYDDYDYTDEDALTAYDEDLGDGPAASTPVLVVDPAGASVAAGEDVRVSGTVRLLDVVVLEDAYGVDLEDDVYDVWDQHLVVVANAVSPASSGSAPGSSSTPSTSSTGGSGEG
ncbi:hypothetical protein [Pseudokineococcus sp. 1T1Z-3]|uniref:hypothetical protein n=1 Tax=Pseudokineococcus sp. 1T1Z-3 TaxID=3132745 RepID=UPI0030A798D5